MANEQKHHGMKGMGEMEVYCNQQTPSHVAGNRFGRLFSLPGLYSHPQGLRDLGRAGGPMDAGKDRTDTVDVGQIFFGQFVDHDITLDVTSSLDRVVADATQIPNTRTPTLDLDCVYGQGPEASPFLYHARGEFAGIKLLTGADGTAAEQEDDLAAEDLARSAQGTAIIGDPRNDENRVISQLQLAMIRFHNNVVDYLHDSEEELEGGELFEQARRLCTWHYQWAVIFDYLVAICGAAIVYEILGKGRAWYCPDGGQPFIPVEFAVAAYRFGHSMIPQTIQLQKGEPKFTIFGDKLGRGFEPLADKAAVVDWRELFDTGDGRTVQKADRLDARLATLLLDLPFIGEGESSLATRNLQRGQAFLLPSGQAVAEHMGRPREEIDNVVEAAEQLFEEDDRLETGSFPAGLPLWFYILMEGQEIGRQTEPGDTDEGEGLGPVGARIVAETIIGLIELDPNSFLASDRSWTPEDGVGVDTVGAMLTYEP